MEPKVKADFEEQRRIYWGLRDAFLKKYPGKWVAICDGGTAGVGETRSEAIEAAYRKCGFRPLYVSRVGEEERVSRRVYRGPGLV